MSNRTLTILLAVAVVLLVAGLVASVTPLAVVGLFSGVALAAVRALASGGDWLRDASSGRFRDHRR